MEDFIHRMKEDYDNLFKIKLQDYVKLFDYLTIKSYRKGEVIKSHEEIETVSRYIFTGEIALYEYRSKKLLCRRIYNPKETACDFESYWSELKSNLILKAFTDVTVAELSKKKEFEVIEDIPSFSKLALLINHRNAKIDAQWKRLHWMDKEEAYDTLRKLCSVFGLIPVMDISTMLNIPIRTVYRLRNKLHKKQK